MKPEMVLSLGLNVHLFMVGTPRGAVGAFFAGWVGAGVATVTGSCFDSAVNPPSPNSENVGLGPDD